MSHRPTALAVGAYAPTGLYIATIAVFERFETSWGAAHSFDPDELTPYYSYRNNPQQWPERF